MNQPTKINDGGPAFPCEITPGISSLKPGMTLRDYFAAAALQGWAAGRNNGDGFRNSADSNPEHIAESCYKYAEAMLSERNKP